MIELKLVVTFLVMLLLGILTIRVNNSPKNVITPLDAVACVVIIVAFFGMITSLLSYVWLQ